MRGQWLGKFEATTWSGTITIEIDEVGGKLQGTAYLFPAKDRFTVVVGIIVPFDETSGPAAVILNLSPINPKNGALVPWDQIPAVFGEIQFARHAQATIERAGNDMTVSWYSSIKTEGKASLTRSDAQRASELPRREMTWESSKNT
jgi:alkylated DNA nucleotide flippase Atl1